MADETYTSGEYQSPLAAEHGMTKIENAVVAKVAGIAAQEIEGVRMGGGTSRAFSGVVDKMSGTPAQSRGVNVDVGQYEAAVDLTMAVEYGRAIPQLAENVRNNIIKRVENLVGLRVTEVNIVIDDIYFEGEESVVRLPGLSGREQSGQEQEARVR